MATGFPALEATKGVSLAEVIEDELEQQFGDEDDDGDDDDAKDKGATRGDKDAKLSALERRLLGWHWVRGGGKANVGGGPFPRPGSGGC